MRPRSPTVDLGIRNEQIALGVHVAVLWETEGQFREVVGFLVAGLRTGDHLVVFGHEEANRRVLEILVEDGIDVEALRESGGLDVLGAGATRDDTLAAIGACFDSAIERGGGVIRLLGNIGWGRAGWPGQQELLEFEGRVADATAGVPCVVVCMYDVRSLSGDVLVHGCFESHPLTLLGNQLRTNPFYRPLPRAREES